MLIFELSDAHNFGGIAEGWQVGKAWRIVGPLNKWKKNSEVDTVLSQGEPTAWGMGHRLDPTCADT